MAPIRDSTVFETITLLEQSLLNFVYENLVLYASHIGSFAFFLEATSQKDPNKTELPEARTQCGKASALPVFF